MSSTQLATPRMVSLDTSASERIGLMMEMVGELSRATEPREVQRIFADRAVELYGPRAYVSLSTRGLPPGQYRITRLATADQRELVAAGDPWDPQRQLPVHTGGFLGHIIRQAYPSVIHHLDLRDDPVLGSALAEYGSMMAIPLFDAGEPLNWAIFFRHDPEGYTIADVEESILRSNLIGGTVRNTLLARELRAAHASIQRGVEQVARIQRALLPQELPSVPGLSFAASSQASDIAAGDLYDFVEIAPSRPGGPNRWAMLIADASGHGPAAAVLTAMLNSILYAYPSEGDGPAAVLRHANVHLHSKRLEGMFVTAFLAVYDPADRSLTYARAGHNPPLVKNAGTGGAVARLDAVGGIPLGITDDAEFEETSVQLQPGQTLVMYTDGITEAASPEGAQFGVEGIERALTICTGVPDCVVGSITGALEEHLRGRRPADDQTLVAMKLDEG